MQSSPMPFVGPDGARPALQITLVVSDPEVILELEKHPVGAQRNDYAGLVDDHEGALVLEDVLNDVEAARNAPDGADEDVVRRVNLRRRAMLARDHPDPQNLS
jgi:hypothetical protein